MRALAVSICLALLLAGCGKPVWERTASDRTVRLVLDAPDDEGLAMRTLAMHRKLGDQTWAPPRLITDNSASMPDTARKPWLLADTLLRVQIAVYPKVSCQGRQGVKRELPPKRFDAGPAPMDAEELKRLGEPVEIAEIWMVSGRRDFLEFRPETGLQIGPTWLGHLLRQAGVGRAVFFPPYQDCAAMVESGPEIVPRRVFFEADGQAGRSEKYLVISPRSPFVAKVLEACAGLVAQREQVIVTYQVPALSLGPVPGPGWREEWTRYTGSVTGNCAGGERRFEYGPFRRRDVVPVLRHDPEPKLTAVP